MVRIIGFQERQRDDGTSFYVLELQGGIETVVSQSTGNLYFTAKKTTIPSTFDENTCKALIGTELPGIIVKEECEPYTHIIQDTGEEILLAHTYKYELEEVKEESVNTSFYESDENSDKRIMIAMS